MFCLEGNYVPKSCWVYFWSSSFGSSSFVRSRSSTDQLFSSFSCSSNLNQLDKKYQFPVMALLADVTNIDWHYSWKQGFPKKLFGNNFEEIFFVIELSDKNWLCPSECDNWGAGSGGRSEPLSLPPPPNYRSRFARFTNNRLHCTRPRHILQVWHVFEIFPYMANHTMINYRGGHTLRSLDYFLYLFQYSGLTPIQKTSLSLVLILIGPNHRHP